MNFPTKLPAGYRWATAHEAEVWSTIPGIIQVRVGGTDEEPWTDLAIPAGPPGGPPGNKKWGKK